MVTTLKIEDCKNMVLTYYETNIGDKKYAFKKLDLVTDIDLLHKWMNYSHVAKIWELNFDILKLKQHFNDLFEKEIYKTPYIAFMNDIPIGYFEQYWAKYDRISKFVDVNEFDQGVHFLIGEKKDLKLTFNFIETFCKMAYASNNKTDRILGEPNIKNTLISKYCHKLGFEIKGTINFPHKTSNFLVQKRTDFFKILENGL